MAINFLDSDVNSMYPHVVNTAGLTPFVYVESSPDSSGVMWYEINVFVTSLQRWIEKQPDDMWCEGTPSWGQMNCMPYLVHESLYTYITLRWS
jgi:hypothetical protein